MRSGPVATRDRGAAVLVGTLVVVPSLAGGRGRTVLRHRDPHADRYPARVHPEARRERAGRCQRVRRGRAPRPTRCTSTPTADSCWDGGRVTGTFPVTTTWNVYHDTAGIGIGARTCHARPSAHLQLRRRHPDPRQRRRLPRQGRVPLLHPRRLHRERPALQRHGRPTRSSTVATSASRPASRRHLDDGRSPQHR